MAEIKLKIASVVIGSGEGGGSGVAPYYADLPDKPTINGETLSGTMTSEDLGLASASQSVPTGGTTGQVLAKKSNADNDVQWVNQQSGGTEVEANPAEAATDSLEKIKIGETTYKTDNPFVGKVQATDAQRIQALANISNQEAGYDASDPPAFTGKMGYKVLQPQVNDDLTSTFAKQIEGLENYIFEIRDVFDLGDPNGENPITIPANCTLKFNGGRIVNGEIIGDFQVDAKDYSSIGDVFTQGYNKVRKFVTCSEVGMIANDATKAIYNGGILDSILAKHLNIIVDGYYYFNVGHTLDYPIEITGTGTIDLTGVAAGNFLSLTDGGSIKVSNITIKMVYDFTERFVTNTSTDFLIDHIEFKNCQIYGGRPCDFNFIDYDASQYNYGINTVLLVNNYCESLYYGFNLSNCAIYSQCLVKGNSFIKCKGAAFQHGNTNEYTYTQSRLVKECEIIVDGNVFDSTGYISNANDVNCLALVESYICTYKNNSVINNIVESATGFACDCYLSCVKVYYLNNYVKNIMAVNTDTGGEPLHKYIAFSKTAPSVFVGQYSERIIENNVWEIDYDYIREQISTVYTEELWNNIANIVICPMNHPVDYKLVKNNRLKTNGILRIGTDTTNVDKYEVIGNVFDVKSIANNYFFISNYNLSKFELTGNIFRTSDGEKWYFNNLNINNETTEVIIRENELCGGTFKHMGIKSLIYYNNYGDINSEYKINLSDKSSIMSRNIPNVQISNDTAYVLKNGLSKFNENIIGANKLLKFRLVASEDSYYYVHVVFPQLCFDFVFLVKIDSSNGYYYIYNTNQELIATNSDGGNNDTLNYTSYVALYAEYVTGYLDIKIGTRNSDNLFLNAEFRRIPVEVGTSYPFDQTRFGLLQTNSGYPLSKGLTKFDVIQLSYDGTNWTDTLGFKTNKHWGTTGERPGSSRVERGALYYDSTLDNWIFRNGGNTGWKEFDGAEAGVARSGTSSSRPSGSKIYIGFVFFDTSISPARPIYASAISGDTVTWVDSTGATV